MSQEKPEKKPQDFLSRLGTTLRSSAESLVQGTKELTAIGKLKVETLSLENERGKKLEEIGRKVYELYKTGTQLPQELLEELTAVDAIEAKIAEKNKEIEELRKDDKPKSAPATPQVETATEKVVSATGFCASCGAPVGPEDKFCSKCGAKIRE